MSKVCVSILVCVSALLVANSVGAATNDCTCQVTNVYAGFIGTGNSSKYKADCADGKSYAFGIVNDELAKSRYSMALAAFMAQKTLVLQYWSSDNSLTCDIASSDYTKYPHGFYVR